MHSFDYPPEVHSAAPKLTTAERLEAELQVECTALKFEVAGFKARLKRRTLSKTLGSVALNAGKVAGAKAATQARRDPLPFAAALGGIAWLAASTVSKGKTSDAGDVEEPPSEKSSALPKTYLPALGLLATVGVLVGSKLTAGTKKG